MIDNKVNVDNLNNEDVIATSAYTCENSPYHLYVIVKNIYGEPAEKCDLYTGNGPENYFDLQNNPLPTELEGYGENYGYLFVDLGPEVNVDDYYYFTGSGWAKCPQNHNPY